MPTVKLSTKNTTASLDDSTQTYKVTGSTKADKVLIYPEVNVTSMDLKSGNDTVHLPYDLSEYIATVKNTTLTLKASDKTTIQMNIGASQTDTLLFADGFASVKNTRGKISIGKLTLQANKVYDLVNENAVQLNASKISETANTADDQALSEISFDETILAFPEGNQDNTIKIKVNRDGTDVSKSASVNYAINFDVATSEASPDDILSNLKGTLVFDSEVTEKFISIKLKGDAIQENDESFNIVLSNPQNAILQSKSKTATIAILNDDDLKTSNNTTNTNNSNDSQKIISTAMISPSENSAVEGETLKYSIKLDKPNTQPININYNISHVNTDNSDFSGSTSGSVTFNAGETSKSISISTKQDANVESDEIFMLNLESSDDIVQLDKSSVKSNIINDDQDSSSTQPKEEQADIISNLSLSVDQASKTEGSTFNYTLSLDKANTIPITVNYSVSNIDTDSSDFSGLTSGSITFNAGETSKTIQINTNDDTNSESDELFNLELSTSADAINFTRSSALGKIINNDAKVDDSIISKLSIYPNQQTVEEGSTFNYTLSLDKANTMPITVNYSVSNVDTDSSDFSGLTSGSVTFNAGETSKSISISSKQDNDVENDEQFYFQISSSSNILTVENSQLSNFILNNDDDFSTNNGISFKSTTGNDSFTATSGADKFIYAQQTTGQDTITGFDPKMDILVFGMPGATTDSKNATPGTVGSVRDHNVDMILNGPYANDVGNDLVIFTDHSSTVKLLGVHKADLTTMNFEFNY